jgi:putative transposase
VNSLKGVSSRGIRTKLSTIKSHWTNRKSGALWSPSYFAGSVGGALLEALKQYIDEQARPH